MDNICMVKEYFWSESDFRVANENGLLISVSQLASLFLFYIVFPRILQGHKWTEVVFSLIIHIDAKSER